jgi:hypothetical protein
MWSFQCAAPDRRIEQDSPLGLELVSTEGLIRFRNVRGGTSATTTARRRRPRSSLRLISEQHGADDWYQLVDQPHAHLRWLREAAHGQILTQTGFGR